MSIEFWDVSTFKGGVVVFIIAEVVTVVVEEVVEEFDEEEEDEVEGRSKTRSGVNFVSNEERLLFVELDVVSLL